MSWNQLSTDHFLNGMIFVCDASTCDDIFQNQVFGLPISYIREMKNLVPYRSALFLLEKHTSLLKGVFIPTCKAKKGLKNDLWNVDGECKFPSQIRFTLYCTMPSIPKESWHLPNFIRLGRVKAKFLDGLRVQMLLQAFQKFEMSNRMLIENSFQTPNPASQYITTTILPNLGQMQRQMQHRGDPAYHGNNPYHNQQQMAHYRGGQQYPPQGQYGNHGGYGGHNQYRGMGPALPPGYHNNNGHQNCQAHNQAPPPPQGPPTPGAPSIHSAPAQLQHDINDELINSLKNEIDMLRVENAYFKTKDNRGSAYPGEELYAGYADEIPHGGFSASAAGRQHHTATPAGTTDHQVHPVTSLDHKMDMLARQNDQAPRYVYN